MRRICAVCGRQYRDADPAVLHRLFRCVDCIGIICRVDGYFHGDWTVLHYHTVRLRFSDGSVAVRYSCDIPARLIHRQSAIPSAGAAADCGTDETWTFTELGILLEHGEQRIDQSLHRTEYKGHVRRECGTNITEANNTIGEES